MKNINGHVYSRKSFDNYKLRLIVEITDKEGEEYMIDIYTTQLSMDRAWDDLIDIISSKVDTFSIIHSATKDQDDLASNAIDEWLNEPK